MGDGDSDPAEALRRTRRERDEARRSFRAEVDKYRRGEPVTGKDLKGIRDKKLKANLKRYGKDAADTANEAAAVATTLQTEQHGFIEEENEMERTFKLDQSQIKEAVDQQTRAMAGFQLNLESTLLGPYSVDYSRSGRSMLLSSRKGHAAVVDWRSAQQKTEIFLNETIRDATFLHNDQYFALAQRKYTFLYDSQGIELHCLRKHPEPVRLAFLPHHFLLASVSADGVMMYTDTTNGKIVAELRSSAGVTPAMAVNPSNACIVRGHRNGTVTIWSPVSSEPLATVLCHRSRLSSVAVHPSGHHMVTAGADGTMKIWDLRTYKELRSQPTLRPASALSISQRGLLAVGAGPHVRVWRDIWNHGPTGNPYLAHIFPSKTVESAQFCPYEDFLGIGHSGGISTLVIPGAGEANFDALLPNPYESTKQRREFEVTALLDKLKPETIALDPNFVGQVEKDSKARVQEVREAQRAAENEKVRRKIEKKRARGRNKLGARLRRKQKNVVDANSEKLKERMTAGKKKTTIAGPEALGTTEAGEFDVLKRFRRKNG